MMKLLPEPILNEGFKNKHNLDCINSMNHIKMFKHHYDDIPRYTKQVYGDKFPQVELNIPIFKHNAITKENKAILHNLMVNIIFYIEADMNVKIKVDSCNFV